MKKFIRENIDHQPIVDNVFKIVSLANDAIAKKGKENIVNATIGSLYDEDGNLLFKRMPDYEILENKFIIGSYKTQNLIYVIVLLEHLEVQEP